MSKSSRKHTRTTTKRATAKPVPPRPWIVDGVDYGPAVAAIGDLATWAFDLAAADVEDWPEGIRRIRSARRYVMSRIEGKRQRSAPIEDVLFAAGLLARIFEAELSLGMSDMVGILDDLGLPSEVVPLIPRVQPSSRPQLHSNVTPLRPRRAAERVAAPREDCGCFWGYRNAA